MNRKQKLSIVIVALLAGTGVSLAALDYVQREGEPDLNDVHMNPLTSRGQLKVGDERLLSAGLITISLGVVGAVVWFRPRR